MKKVTAHQLDFIKNTIIHTLPDAKIWLFGSRITGTAKNYSDLDVLIKTKNKIPLEKIALIKEIFENSNLPIKIDIVDWHRITDEFRELILRDAVKSEDL